MTSPSPARSRSTTAASATGGSNCIALTNFWRTLGNLSLHISTPDRGCRTGANFWAVSQAVSLRRVDVSGGNLSLMDYCTAGPQYASGGFIADSQLPTTINGSQQQWLTRNSEVGNWTNGVWNQVFAGVVGAPPMTRPSRRSRTRRSPTTPVSREKPYLYVDDGGRVLGSCAVGADGIERHVMGRRRDGGSQHPDLGVLHREAERLGAGHQQQRSRAGRT